VTPSLDTLVTDMTPARSRVTEPAVAGVGDKTAESTAARLQNMLIGAALCVGDHDYLLFRHKSAAAWLRRCCAHGLHEPIMSRLVIEFMRRRPRAVFMDIGALFGYFGLLAMVASKGRASVYLFEMNPESLAALENNVLVNAHVPHDRIRVTHAAVGDVDAAARETHYSYFKVGAGEKDATAAPLRFLTIDGFSKEQGIVPSLIKIDVEGYEGKVLRGALQALRQAGTVALLELHHNKVLSLYGTSRSEILHQLLDDGLKLYYFGKHRVDIDSGRINAVALTRDYLQEHRDKISLLGNDLIVISREDIREHWPDLNLMTSGDVFPTGMLARG